MASGEHNAAASAAGYLYQVRWALLNLLREDGTNTLPKIKKKFDEVAALTDRFV